MSSSGSVDLLSYQDSLENVLTWLLEAEEVVETQEVLGNTVVVVKKQFSEHEVSAFLCHLLQSSGDIL